MFIRLGELHDFAAQGVFNNGFKGCAAPGGNGLGFDEQVVQANRTWFSYGSSLAQKPRVNNLGVFG